MGKYLLIKDSDNSIEQTSEAPLGAQSGYTTVDVDEDTNAGDAIPTSVLDMAGGQWVVGTRTYTAPVVRDHIADSQAFTSACTDYYGEEPWSPVFTALSADDKVTLKKKVMSRDFMALTDAEKDALVTEYP